jgi:hypothetical protein
MYELAQLNVAVMKAPLDSPLLSVWSDVGALSRYVYRSAHMDVMRRRRDWFERSDAAHMVLWWVPAGHRPTVEEAFARLETLRARGPSPDAFTFAQPHDAPAAEK